MIWSEFIQNIKPISHGQLRDPEVLDITQDSRSVHPGSVFVAISGFKMEGDSFINEAISKGAVAVISENKQTQCPIPWIQVANTRQVLSILAQKLWNIQFDAFTTVGITGTNGKTTTAELFYTLYSLMLGTPNAWLFSTVKFKMGETIIDAHHTTPEIADVYRFIGKTLHPPKAVVLEISSHALALHRVSGLQCDCAVWTNLTQDHLDFHEDMISYYESKKKLFTNNLKEAGTAVINIDDTWGLKLSKELPGVRLVTYGFRNQADLHILKSESTWTGTEIKIRYLHHNMVFKSNLVGYFNTYNMAAMIAGALSANISEQEIQKAFTTLPGVVGRMEKVALCADFTVIIDYAHTPDALENVLSTAAKLTLGRLLCVFGCGGERDVLKRPLMAQAVVKFCDEAIITSDNPRTESPVSIIDSIVEGIPLDFTYLVIADRKKAIGEVLKKAQKNDCIIIAGKGHESYQDINGIRYPFDDKEVVLDLWKEMEYHSEND